MKKGIIVLISGPSGVGKGTILKELINNKALNLTFSVSMTTRAKREKEVHGEHYFFVSQEEFAANLKRDNFLEHATFVGNSYGTPKDYVFNLLNEGKNVLIEIEVKGAKTLISKVDPEDIISFYIMPPSVDDLIYRLKHRGTEDDATIMRRAEQFKDEIKYKDQYDHAVVNDDLETCIKEVTALIEARINKK
ncbi:MAG: guanylate kinase [Bacilli bacterium]